MSSEFEYQVIESIHYILCPAVINRQSIATISPFFRQWADSHAKVFVWDFKRVTTLGTDFYQAIGTFKSSLDAKDKDLMSINMSDKVLNQIEKQGLQKLFNHKSDFNRTEAPKKMEPDEVKRKILRYFVNAAYNAFQVTLNSTVTADENYTVAPTTTGIDQYDMISTVGVSFNKLNLNVRLCLAQEVIDELAKRIVGEENVDADLVDSTAKELLNLIYGVAKSRINDDYGIGMPAAIPTLFKKPDFSKIRRASPDRVTVLPLVTPLGSCFLEVEFLPHAT